MHRACMILTVWELTCTAIWVYRRQKLQEATSADLALLYAATLLDLLAYLLTYLSIKHRIISLKNNHTHAHKRLTALCPGLLG